jgi:hypothetical protein
MKTMRRAGKQWRATAPDCVVDCFYEPDFSDCYTVVTNQGYEHNGTNFYLVFSSSPNLGTSGWHEMKHHDITAYRYRCGHKRIKWEDVPEVVRSVVEIDGSEVTA